ncbi:MAG: carboxymuconolactone decarboxylase family protein [Rhodothalassiaceae bacterium]
MSAFTLHDKDSAPEGARPLLEAVEKKFGFIPGLMRVMAESPQAMEGYLTLSRLFEASGFDPVERQVVLLTVSAENGCTYCVAAHSGAAKMAGMPEAVLSALRAGRPLPDAKLEALRRFTHKMVEKRGWLEEADIETFLAAGYERRHVLDVILGVALKTLSNCTNHVAHTPLDEAFKPLAWQPPASAAAE